MVTDSASSSASSTGVTVIDCGTFQLPEPPPVKLTAPDTVAAPASPDDGVTVTVAPAPGSLPSTTV